MMKQHTLTLLRAAVLTGGLLWAATAALAWTHDSGDKDNEWVGTWSGCCNWRDYSSCAFNDQRAAHWTQSDWQFRGRFQVRVHLDGCCNYQHGGNCPYYIQRSGGGTVFTPWKNQCNENGDWRDLHTANWNGDSDRFWRLRLSPWDCAYPNCSGWNEAAAGAAHFYGEKWDYINDWVCLGGYSGTIGDNATGWTESDIYLYPAVDTSHGNVFNYGGKVPGRVQTGDCNWANKLDWKGNASSYGNCDNCYSYGFAWMYSPGGAGPKFLIGADDDQRTYVNGTLISSGTQCCNRDNFETGGIGMPAGWSRILFKVRNGSGGFNGTVSLRNGGDRGWNEGSVTRYSGSYGLGYEQNDWYPRIDVANFYGGSNPQPNANYYGNNTTVTASGTASVTGPVPFWKVMHFEWGYGISEGNYADVSSSGTSWSHTQSGVTGHRRFHFFSVSKSKRCSFQNNGTTGGWNWGDGGPGNYMDVYVDNVAPQNPSFSSVTAASTSQINLAWAIPLDQGVGIGAGATEAADEASATSSNHYRRGDVGVQVYRDASPIYTWGTDTSKNDTGLTANTAYTYTIEARDNTSQGRGAWANTTGQKDSQVVWTLSVPPTTNNVTRDVSFFCAPGTIVNWTAVGGFGAGKVQYYRYVWNQSPTHNWADNEALWSSGTLNTTPTAGGNWYLHVKGYNGANVGNGTLDHQVIVSNGTEKWIGGDGPWDTVTMGLWQDTTPNAVTYCDGHDVLFDDSACGEQLNQELQKSMARAAAKASSALPGEAQVSNSAQLAKLNDRPLTLPPPEAYSDNTAKPNAPALSDLGPVAAAPTMPALSDATFGLLADTGDALPNGGQPSTGVVVKPAPGAFDAASLPAPSPKANPEIPPASQPAGEASGSPIADGVASGDSSGVESLPPTALSSPVQPKINDPIALLESLATSGPASEGGQPFVLGVLPGTKVLALETAGDTTTVEFSPDILGREELGTKLDEARLTMIFNQVRIALRQCGFENSIRLQTGGKLLSSYLPPVKPVEPGPTPKAPPPTTKANNLGGKNICLGPSHGRYWNGSGWYWQRTDPCGYGEDVLEDCNSIRLMQFLYQYLTQDGATVHVARELNESNCCNGYEGQPWWKMAAYSWLRANGLPCSVWGSSSGNCGAETATSRLNDDIRARPLFADYRGSDIYIAHHTNAGGGTGTETYRDTAMEHPAHVTASYNLALAIHNNTIDAIRDMYDGSWANRGVKDSAGGFGEIRIPNRPACLIELAFHDKCSVDALYLKDDFFRSVAEWGLYKGICSYFGTTPGWDKYSDEYVSDTIPSTMNAGQNYTVSVTFRNRGVLWREARAFRLGAVGDSDPFTATTRHTISGDVRPGNTYTFTFTMTAPLTPGTYTTDWRMVRDGVTWFGATHSEQVTVVSLATPPSITSQPVSQTVTQGGTATFSVVATGTAPLTYQWRLNGTAIAGATQSSYTKSNVQPADGGNYSVVVSNSGGNATSANALLTVIVPPSITTQPASQAVNQGSTATFSVVATGTTPLAYQWRFNGNAIAGATQSSYSKGNAQPADGGNYSVVITNSGGSVTSANALLTIIVPPSILTQPANQTVNLGGTASFSVVASGTAPLTYQWRFNGTDIIGATLDNYTKNGVLRTDAGGYSVEVANAAGSVVSANALLSVSCLGSSNFITLNGTVIPKSVTNNSTSDYTISGTGRISGLGGVTKLGSGTLTLRTTNDYSGATTVSDGKLLVNGAIGNGPVLVDGTGILGGNGAVGGNVTVANGGLLSPGAQGIGTLTVSGDVTFQSGSQMGVEVDRNGGNPQADKVAGIGALTQGGTLYVTNKGDALQVGDQFTLFSAASYGGEFAEISPVNPNDEPDDNEQELAWDKPLLKTNGILRVHHVPFATNRVFYRAVGVSLKIRLNTLFPSLDPVDGDTVTLASHTPGLQGAGISNNATTLFYYPANHNNDSLEYTVSDGRGGVRKREIKIYVTNYVQALAITEQNGSNYLSFYGIPGYEYVIQRSPDLTNPNSWSDIATQACSTNGLYIFVEAPPYSPVYYRARTP
ncbi:MAG TPA: immunoglobulin domain-containing protein [Verrucomicrobiota bacterium]|nr:immunoglobulin domain-containing protein [Verrucomicrobiota bacterium]